jgi:hypothetical protein
MDPNANVSQQNALRLYLRRLERDGLEPDQGDVDLLGDLCEALDDWYRFGGFQATVPMLTSDQIDAGLADEGQDQDVFPPGA